MGNRLSKITTRTGDDGSTGLGDGSRISKDHLRVRAMGDVDELNSQIGVLLAEKLSAGLAPEFVQEFAQEFQAVQQDLFDLGGELCIPGYKMITAEHIARLDMLLAKYNADLPPLKNFILPGGTRATALAHVCRTVCRRAERSVVSLGNVETLHDEPRQYLNRLSDLFFVVARVLNRAGDGAIEEEKVDVLWRHTRAE